jgi:hypothetical protein
VRKIKGGLAKYKEREYSDVEEESLSITMETKPVDEENEYNHKYKIDSEEVNLEEELISALEKIDKLMGKNIKQKEKFPKH